MRYVSGVIYMFVEKDNEQNVTYLCKIDHELNLCINIEYADLFFSADHQLQDLLENREVRVHPIVTEYMDKCDIYRLETQRVQFTEVGKKIKL